ncbi:protein kinase [Streptomyces sp. WMMC905]|uniref:protein kinase n=2 Tax=unclassified Streptomyces TaxID=2593676 RepID=UPI003B953046
MDDYAGRVLADRYRLPLPPVDAGEPAETRAFDTYSGQEVLVRQVPLPEVVEAEVLDADGLPEGFTARDGTSRGPEPKPGAAPAAADPVPRADPLVRRAVEAARAAAELPDHPRLDQVFDVFAEGGSLWVVSELVAARPLAAVLAERSLTAYRAAEVAADVLTALRVLHGHGWVHRNVTARTVLICDDGRVLLTGLAVGAAEEALCGHDPLPEADDTALPDIAVGPGGTPLPGAPTGGGAGRGAADAGQDGWGGVALPGPAAEGRRAAAAGNRPGASGAVARAFPALDGPSSGEGRAARAGAIAAYRAGARAAAARVRETRGEAPALPGRDPYTAGGVTAPRRTHDAPAPGPNGGDAGVARPAAPRPPVPSEPPGAAPGGARGPAGTLAAERARQARMSVVGPVTERWAPEQAGPVHGNWRLAPPVGPATDLWALGALLFRAVQGHAPYPEESTAELVQLVCAEPPAFAEECGPLRPVVESLLRRDPTERLGAEELRGWLRSLVRSAPEPDAGLHVVPAPPVDTGRLPVVRRRGELVRRRRAGPPARSSRHGRREGERSPHRLGRLLLLLVLLGVAGAVAYAALLMPRADAGAATGAGRVASAPSPNAVVPDGRTPPAGSSVPSHAARGTETRPAGSESPVDVPEGFTLRTDPEGFRVAVAEGWDRSPANDRGQVVYAGGRFRLLIVPGRDGTTEYGTDPMAYQREREPELQPYRDSTWATSTGMRTVEVGGRVTAEGQFTWTGADGSELYVRNLALLIDDRYHIVQVLGPESERDEVTRLFERAAATYRPAG